MKGDMKVRFEVFEFGELSLKEVVVLLDGFIEEVVKVEVMEVELLFDFLYILVCVLVERYRLVVN